MTKKIRDPKIYYEKLINGEIPNDNEHIAFKIITETIKNENEKEDTEMKTLEIEKKRLEEVENKKRKYFDLYKQFDQEYYLEMAKEQAAIAESIKIRINRAERAKNKAKEDFKGRSSLDRAIKELQIEMAAKESGIYKEPICAGTSSITATAIIDEIIESEFDAENKLLMIKLFLDNHLSSLDISGLLYDEMIIIPRKRVK